MQIKLPSQTAPVVRLGKQATITEGDMKVTTDYHLYRVEIEIHWDSNFERFLKEMHSEHMLRYHITDSNYGDKTIVVNCQRDSIVWIGYWYKEWQKSL
jgi:hypothetical protein